LVVRAQPLVRQGIGRFGDPLDPLKKRFLLKDLHTSGEFLLLRHRIPLIKKNAMYWTLELASYLSDAPWPATKDELIDYAIRTGAPLEVVENLQAIEEEEGEVYESIEEIWPDYPSDEDFLWNEEEY
jgi:hypothetical protein